ncbi:type IIL restriction-modification enzyme MmeI, partial [Staphylococcus saprophyticus]
DVMKDLFEIVNMNESKGFGKLNWVKVFGYVKGKVFEEGDIGLSFRKVWRKLLIEGGELVNWNEINGDMLGCMIE